MTEFRMPSHDGRNHRGCGGEVTCIYEGHGDWTGLCQDCEKEVKACGDCEIKPYPDPSIIIASLPIDDIVETVQEHGEILYRCAICGFLVGPETLYLFPGHLTLTHKIESYLHDEVNEEAS